MKLIETKLDAEAVEFADRLKADAPKLKTLAAMYQTEDGKIRSTVDSDCREMLIAMCGASPTFKKALYSAVKQMRYK
jgi:hypothetical protein